MGDLLARQSALWEGFRGLLRLPRTRPLARIRERGTQLQLIVTPPVPSSWPHVTAAEVFASVAFESRREPPPGWATAAPQLRVAAAKIDRGLPFPLADLTTLISAGLFPSYAEGIIMVLAFAATVTEFLRRLDRHLSSSTVLQLLGLP